MIITMDTKQLPFNNDIDEIDPYVQSSRIVIDMFNELDIPSLENAETNNNVTDLKEIQSNTISGVERYGTEDVTEDCDDSVDFYSLPSVSDEESCSNLLQDDELSKIDLSNSIFEDEETLPSAIVDLVEERSLKETIIDEPHANAKVISVNLTPFSQFKLPIGPSEDQSNLTTTVFQCLKCRLRYKTKADIDEHKCYPRKKKIFACDKKCNFKTEDFNMLKAHRATHVTIYTCRECNYRCKIRSLLKRHTRTHSQNKPLSCDACQFTCKSHDGLHRHKVRMHSLDTLLYCDQCKFNTRRIQVLESHKKTHKMFQCNKCNFGSMDQGEFLLHTLSHFNEKEKQFQCDECDYSTYRFYDLTRHKSVHQQDKPNACPECEYTCRDKSGLKAHLLTHMGLKPYACDQCEYTCTLHTRMSTHKLLTHKGGKQYPCHLCSYKCKSKRTLIKHKTVHL